MKKAKEKKHCRQCGRSFVPKKPWQEYDKTKCRKAAWDGRRAEQLRRADEIIKQAEGA